MPGRRFGEYNLRTMKTSRAFTSTAGEQPPPEAAPGSPNLRTRPLHEEISHRARELWQSYGCPAGRDEQIWLEAERQLLGADSQVVGADGAMAVEQLNQASISSTATSTPGGGRRGTGRVIDQSSEEAEEAAATAGAAGPGNFGGGAAAARGNRRRKAG